MAQSILPSPSMLAKNVGVSVRWYTQLNPTPYCPALRLSFLLLPVPRLEIPFRSSAVKLPSFLTSNAGPCSLAQLSLKTGPLPSWDLLSRMKWISVDPESSAFWMSSLPS